MEIIVGKTAGFCYGVKRAVDISRESIKESKNVYSVQNVVHNAAVNEDLENQGLHFVETINEVPDGAEVIIRAHGVTPEELEECKKKKLKIIDTTCPNVKTIHRIVSEYSGKGYGIVIIGDEGHPEVLGIEGRAGENNKVINSIEQAEKIDYKNACIVSQTTMNIEMNAKITEKLKGVCENFVVFDTICRATEDRQNELRELAKDVDCIIVIGDKKSANSNRLYEIAKKLKKSQFIEKNEELCLNFLPKSCRILVMAGASTPQFLIDEVISKIEEKF